jgi:hypothetical protein
MKDIALKFSHIIGSGFLTGFVFYALFMGPL